MEASPKVKASFGPSGVVAGRPPLNSISQTTLNQLPGEAGGASTHFERKPVPVFSRGAVYPYVGYAEATVAQDKHSLPQYAATTTPRSKYAWEQRPSSPHGTEPARKADNLLCPNSCVSVLS